MPQIAVPVYPPGIKVTVTPDAPTVPWPEHIPLPAKLGVFEWAPQADGSYRPVIRLHDKMVRLKANITEELGLGISYDSLRRLMRAGFVKSEQRTPGQYAFCLQSYFQHVAAVRADPEFWSGKNLRRYMEAI